MTKTRIFVVEDHPVTRYGLEQLIGSQADMLVCGGAEDAMEALRGIDDTRPDFVITDLSLKDTDGLELVKQIHAKNAAIHVLVLSMYDESLYALRALRAGARGYIMKVEAPDKLLIAVRRIVAGEVYLSERESTRALSRLSQAVPNAPASPVERLSDRELEVFRWIGRGSSLREIAERLNLSVKTVETYCAHIKTKFNITNSRELAREAVLWIQQSDR